jgi:hypothetical protein
VNEINWKSWTSPEDLPHDVRAAIRRGVIHPLLEPNQAAHLRKTILEAFSEVLEIYQEDNELKWRCEFVSQNHPDLPKEAIFRAVSLEVGVSVDRVRELWFKSRRKSRVKELVLRSLRREG